MENGRKWKRDRILIIGNKLIGKKKNENFKCTYS